MLIIDRQRETYRTSFTVASYISLFSFLLICNVTECICKLFHEYMDWIDQGRIMKAQSALELLREFEGQTPGLVSGALTTRLFFFKM